VVLWVVGACTSSGSSGAGDPGTSDPLYDLSAFPRFDLEIPEASIRGLAADPTSYVPAVFRHGDEELQHVGVRLKGSFTFRALDEKASFKVKFDKFSRKQRFRGLRRMTFNNLIEDPSFIAERLTYLAFRNAGLPAPRQNSARIYVNGESYGVYGNVETEDKLFLRRWFASNDGNLYEDQGVDWFPGSENDFELETNEDINDRSDLTALFEAVATARPDTLLEDVSGILDSDHFLRYCALEALVNQWDGYAYTQVGPNNYRLYHDPTTGRFTLLPWGMDMSIKPWDGRDFIDVYEPAGHLLQRCLHESPPCRAAFESVLAEEADRFAALDLAQVAREAYDLIRDDVHADPRKEVSIDEFEATFAQVLAFTAARPASVGAQLP
jgi:hypothetical protein